MNKENWWLVIDKHVEFEKYELQDFRNLTGHFRGIYNIYLNSRKKIQKMSTCNWLDLETLGYQLVMSKNIPRHGHNFPRNEYLTPKCHGGCICPQCPCGVGLNK